MIQAVELIGSALTVSNLLFLSGVQCAPLPMSWWIGITRRTRSLANFLSISFSPFTYKWLKRWSRCHLRVRCEWREKNSPPRADEQLSAPFRRATLCRFKPPQSDRCKGPKKDCCYRSGPRGKAINSPLEGIRHTLRQSTLSVSIFGAPVLSPIVS